MRSLLLAGVSAAALALSGGSAMAADFFEPAAPVGIYDWSGGYVGAHLGVGWRDGRFYTDWELLRYDCEEGDGDFDDFCFIDKSGFGALGGFQAGYQLQDGNVVWGVEGDASWVHIPLAAQRGDDGWCCTSRNSDIDLLASLRGRLGFAMDRALIYGTAGIGYVHGVAHKDTSSFYDGRVDLHHFAPVVGAGFSYALDERISVGLEGLAYFLDVRDTLSDDNSIQTNNIYVGRLTFNYKLP